MTPAREPKSGKPPRRRRHVQPPNWRTDPRVDAYIAALSDWQQAICQQVRELAHAADPQVEETIKRRVQPYFVLEGNIAALLAAKDHVNVFIYDPTVPDAAGIINLGRDNKAARGIQIYESDAVNLRARVATFRAVIANNRAGGWHDAIKTPAHRAT